MDDHKPVRLLTGISYATLTPPGAERGVRGNASAVLLEPGREDAPLGGAPRIRAMGIYAAWPVFDYVPGCDALDYESDGAFASSAAMLRENGELTPISQGSVLTFADGTTLALTTAGLLEPQPIVSDDFEATFNPDVGYATIDYDRLWRTLELRTAEAWDAPYAPFMEHGPIDRLREIRRRGAREQGIEVGV